MLSFYALPVSRPGTERFANLLICTLRLSEPLVQ